MWCNVSIIIRSVVLLAYRYTRSCTKSKLGSINICCKWSTQTWNGIARMVQSIQSWTGCWELHNSNDSHNKDSSWVGTAGWISEIFRSWATSGSWLRFEGHFWCCSPLRYRCCSYGWLFLCPGNYNSRPSNFSSISTRLHCESDWWLEKR